MNKRGISVVISSLLLVVLVISLTALAYAWSRGILFKAQSESSIQKSCSDLNFKVADFCLNKQTVHNIDKPDTYSYNIKFDIRNNAGDQSISGFIIDLVDKAGDYKPLSTFSFESVGGYDSKQLITDYIDMSTINDLSKITLIPQINESGNIISCDSQKVSVSGDNLNPC